MIPQITSKKDDFFPLCLRERNILTRVWRVRGRGEKRREGGAGRRARRVSVLVTHLFPTKSKKSMGSGGQ